MPATRNERNRPKLIVGLMSGTSADGIDAVVASISRHRKGNRPAQVVAHLQKLYPEKLRQQILRVSTRGTVSEICELNFILGEYFARAALGVIAKAGLDRANITAIASHGQTIHHLPGTRYPSTLQIGEPSVIVERTGITTVADFRTRDMAAGGQGAPLVPFADWRLFTHHSRPRIVQNIGGIGNLTFLPPGAELKEILAFDTGPGNMVMDGVVEFLSQGRQAFDRGGKQAARGVVCGNILNELMRHPFLKRRPPKTTGREEFGEEFLNQLLVSARRSKISDNDLVATVTAFTAQSIVDAFEKFIFPKCNQSDLAGLQVILGGGGAKNPSLKRMLAERLAKFEVRNIYTHEDFGIANAAKEALAFAMLGYETLQGRPGNAPSATGAKRPVVLGKIIFGTLSAPIHHGI